jgi:hypothetical protein
MKRRDYEAAGLKGLPRNGPLKFREELLLIPGFEKLFQAPEDGLLDYFAPVPPEGLPAVWMKPSFFSANKEVLKLLGNLSEDEAAQAAKARFAWHGERPFSESLSPALYKKLESSFSFTESGCYRIVAKGFSEEGGVATLVMSLRVMAQPQGSGASYYEWMQY